MIEAIVAIVAVMCLVIVFAVGTWVKPRPEEDDEDNVGPAYTDSSLELTNSIFNELSNRTSTLITGRMLSENRKVITDEDVRICAIQAMQGMIASLGAKQE